MKIYQAIVLVAGVLAALVSCQPETGEISPDQPGSKGTPTETGKPIGAPTSKVIGPQGGSISTPDKKLTLTFPAGALSKETTITVQPVENKAINGVGIGYEFGPDGSQFAKPVTFTYQYDESEVAGVTIDAMGLAFQDKNRVWMLAEPVTVNKAKKTITGSISHFSWWSLITQYLLEPEIDTVLVGQVKELKLINAGLSEWPWWEGKTPPSDGSELLVPLTMTTAKRSTISKIYLNGTD